MVYPDRSGHVIANHGSFPIYVMECESSHASEEINSYISEYHWHTDLEFIHVEDGVVDIIVNDTPLHVAAGQGIFINSGRLHRIETADSYRRYITVRIDPQLFTNSFDMGSAYFDRKFGGTNIDYYFLDPSIDWQSNVVDRIDTICKQQETIETKPLSIMATALSLLEVLGNHIPDSVHPSVNKNDYDSFIAMTQFISEHVGDKIQIEDIAHAGHVSRAKVYTLFNNFANQSPNTYLMVYRVEKSASLLRSTNLSIADIASMCGFRTPSYFASVFRKENGLTPREYRTKHQ